MNKNIFPAFLILLFAWSACESGTETEPALDPDTGKSYFWLEPGKFREYDVFEIRYRAVGISDTFRYQLREEVREAIDATDAEKAHVIYRYSRQTSQEDWSLDSLWSARIEQDVAISVENNIPVVKIAFPAVEGREWDANTRNIMPLDTFRIVEFDPRDSEENTSVFTFGINSFAEVLVVEQSSEDNPVFIDARTEVYKDSLGLVFKEYNQVTFCTTTAVCAFDPLNPQQFITRGRFYREILFNHGFLE